jgi:serine/threonine-protein kinase haspin
LQALTPENLKTLDPLLKIVEQDGVKDFQDFGRSIGKKYFCTKLGEGSYADVYELQAKDPDEAQILVRRGGLIVKVIRFCPTFGADDIIADLDAVTREIRLFQAVDALHGFVRCRGAHIVSGGYPDVLLEAFEVFKATHSANTAQNPQPSAAAAGDQQLYAILEMNHAGTPMGKLKSASAFQVFDIFWRTAITLALAEKELEFEHRDLHNDNVCLKSMSKDGALDMKQELVEELKERPEVILGLSNLQVTIIDYTYSRATIPTKAEGEVVIFDPIECWDTDAKEVETDTESDKLQYRTYGMVRELAKTAEADAIAAAQVSGIEYQAVDKYERFIPKSNVLWLRYVLVDLLAKGGSGRGASLPGSSRTAKRLQLELWKTMGEVESYLSGTSGVTLPASADELISMAVEKAWLGEGDVAAFKEQTEE